MISVQRYKHVAYLHLHEQKRSRSRSVSKYRTLKASSQTVLVQVQPIRYQSQPGHDPHGYNPANYQLQYHWARYRQLSNLPINPSALNATQGHKPSYQTSYLSIPNNGDDPVLLQPHMDTSLAIKQDISIPNDGDNPVL